MDPFSIATGVVSLLAVIAEVSGKVNSYITAVKDKKQDVRDLHQELLLLGGVLGQLKDFLSSDEAKQTSFDTCSVLDSAIADCMRRMVRVADRLKPSAGGKFSRTVDRLKWPYEQDEVRKIATALQRFTLIFQFALQVEGLTILTKASANAEASLRQQQEECREMLAIMRQRSMSRSMIGEFEIRNTKVDQMLDILPMLMNQAEEVREIGQNLRIQEEREQAKQKGEILEWLVPTTSLQKHVEHQRKRIENTCQWLLQSQAFQDWKSLDVPPHDFLCIGNPGVGKSVLASFVFDHLRMQKANQGIVVLNYYCSHFDEQTQNPAFFDRVMLRQLCQSLDRMPSVIVDFYRETVHSVEDVLWLQRLQSVLHRVISTFDHVFLVLDALDELENVRQRNILLHSLQQIKTTKDSVRVLATSRPHLTAIHPYFRSPYVLDISASQQDVELYLRQSLAEDHVPEFIDLEFQDSIVSKLRANATGSFLLPALQLDHVLQQLTKIEARRALEALSQTLDDAFRTTLDRIRGLPNAHRDLASRAMMWISFARRPLTMAELQHALATQEDQTDFEMDNVVPSRYILESCAGLVQYDGDSGLVSFVHFSLDEYLRTQAGLFANAEVDIVRTCLTYVAFRGMHDLWKKAKGMHEAIKRYPFFRYAAHHWGIHAKQIKVESYLDLALRLFDCAGNILTISRLRHLDNAYSRNWKQHALSWVYSGGVGISIASAFGLTGLLGVLIDQTGDKSIIKRCHNVYGRTALEDAAAYGHTSVCEVLIDNGADLMDNNRGKATAFFSAVAYGHLETARILLKYNRAQLDVHCRFGFTALHKASDAGDQAAVELLLASGALVGSRDDTSRTALHLASKAGHFQVVQLLVLAGADSNTTSDEGRPLDLCSTFGHCECARYLLQQGAGVNFRGRGGWTPLLCASRGGHLDIVKLLLEQGANVLDRDYYQNSCLSMASRSGNIGVVKMLLEHDQGSRISLLKQTDAKGRTAQQTAFITAHFVIYRLLRDLENDLEQPSSTTDSASANKSLNSLTKLIEARDGNAVELLIGARPELLHAADASGQQPVHAAFVDGATEIAAFLLKAGSSIHAAGFHGWRPLHIAASVGSLDLVNLALINGANIEEKTGTSQTALHKAAASGSVAVLKRLLEAGANIRALNDRAMTSLHIAASKDFLDGVRELLLPAWGAQDLVFARDRNKKTAYDWADRNGRLEIATFLRLQEKSFTNSDEQLTPTPVLLRQNTLKQTTSGEQSGLYRLTSAQGRTLSNKSLVQDNGMDDYLELLELDSN